MAGESAHSPSGHPSGLVAILMSGNENTFVDGPVPELRQYPVAVSVEQLALAWLRTEEAQSGSVVMVDHEIVPRQRLGVPWTVPAAQSVSFAVVIRCQARLEDESLLSIAALVAVARSCESVGITSPRLGWPDYFSDSEGVFGGSVTIEAQLGPGVVQSAIVSVRINTVVVPVAKDSERPLAEAFARHLHHIVSRFETTRADLLSEYDMRSVLLGQRVRVRLLPKGDTRGTVGPVTAAGNLPLQSPTGMLELLNPATVLRVDPF